MKEKKVTIYTLAEELGMTPSMISRALNHTGKVDESKREIIINAARKYNYMPNKFASRLSMKQIRIGILIYCRFKPVVDEMIKGIERAYDNLRDYKIEYDITVISSKEKKAWECVDELNNYANYDGVILAGFSSAKCVDMINQFAEKNRNIAQMQSVNEDVEYLFASKHNEKVASYLGAEFLYNCLKHAEKKNVLLFTGDMDSTVHKNAHDAFLKVCEELGLHVVDCIDMQDKEEVLKELLPEVFAKYKEQINGIYISSGNSIELCSYVKEHCSDMSLVTFDIHEALNPYVEDGTVCATIFQNVTRQAENAFDGLAKFIINDQPPERVIYTDVQIVMKSNIKYFI